jgi:serine/threonine-protein kinase HipA
MWPYFGNGPNPYKRRQAGLAMAMRSKNVQYRLDAIQTRHWHQLAMKNGGRAVWNAMAGLALQVGPALTAVAKRLPKDFHGRSWDTISKGMTPEAKRFLARARRALKCVDRCATFARLSRARGGRRGVRLRCM